MQWITRRTTKTDSPPLARECCGHVDAVRDAAVAIVQGSHRAIHLRQRKDGDARAARRRVPPPPPSHCLDSVRAIVFSFASTARLRPGPIILAVSRPSWARQLPAQELPAGLARWRQR